MKHRSLFIMLFLGLSALAATKPKAKPTPAPTPTGNTRVLKYYEIGKTDGPVIYTQKIQYETGADGNLTSKSTVTDPKGNEVFKETVISKGSMPIFQSADVQQTKRHLELEVKEGRVFMRTRALSAEKPLTEQPKEDQEKLPDSLITGAIAETFAIEHWDALMKGETVSTKMAIMEIRELVTFKFWKLETKKDKDREYVIIAMKPSSLFIAFLVDTIYLHIDLKTKKMFHYVGRTPLWKVLDDGKLKALDAEIVFE